MMRRPKYSPWGEVQRTQGISEGIYEVITASHGGIMVDAVLAKEIFSEAAQKCGFIDGEFLCFEEDCDAAVAIRELLDKGIKQTPINKEYREGSYSEAPYLFSENKKRPYSIVNDGLLSYFLCNKGKCRKFKSKKAPKVSLNHGFECFLSDTLYIDKIIRYKAKRPQDIVVFL